MADARTPLGPINPQHETHLNNSFGPPQEFLWRIEDNRDIYAIAWRIGYGEARLPKQPNGTERGTEVEIRLTPKGNLLTTRRAWTRRPDGTMSDSLTGQAHATPMLALEWLKSDGHGKLGPASKMAWIRACENFPPMSDFRYERIE